MFLGNNLVDAASERTEAMARTGRMTAGLAALLTIQAAAGEELFWQYGGHTIGHLTIPTGFAIETYNYREGIVTTLHRRGLHSPAIRRHVPSTYVSGLRSQTQLINGVGGKDNQGGRNRWFDALPA